MQMIEMQNESRLIQAIEAKSNQNNTQTTVAPIHANACLAAIVSPDPKKELQARTTKIDAASGRGERVVVRSRDR